MLTGVTELDRALEVGFLEKLPRNGLRKVVKQELGS
jgi:hypothetical protein